MPVHKELLGDKLRAAKWLPHAMVRLRAMRQWRTMTMTYAPTHGVLVNISSTSGGNERIVIRAELAVPGYEFFTYIKDVGNYRTAHQFSPKSSKVSSTQLDESRILTNYDVAGPDPDLGGVCNNPWYRGKKVVTGGLQRRYVSTFNTDAADPLDLPPEVTNFSADTRVSGPAGMLINAAAINNGILVGVDSNGVVYAAESISDTADFITDEPVYPSWVDKVGADMEWTSYWRFNHDGTKAVTLMFDENGDPPGSFDFGAVIELSITADRDVDGNVTLAVEVDEYPLERGKEVFAVDYYNDEVTIAALHATGDETNFNEFLVMETLEGEELFFEPTWVWWDNYRYTFLISYLDISRLAVVGTGVMKGDEPVEDTDLLQYLSAKARTKNKFKIVETGLSPEDVPGFDAAVTPQTFPQYAHTVTGDVYPMIGHANNRYLATTNRAVAVTSDGKGWGSWLDVDAGTHTPGGYPVTLPDLELDFVILTPELETTHRELYDNLRAKQLAAGTPDPLPELPALIQDTGQPINAVPMLNAAWYPRR